MDRYQDYVIKDGKFIGKFEEMYQKFDDPWHQSENGNFDDFAIVCQGQNLKYNCDWLEIFNIKVKDKILEVCAFKDSSGKIFLEKYIY